MKLNLLQGWIHYERVCCDNVLLYFVIIIEPFTVIAVLLFCRAKWHTLVKYDVMPIVAFTSFTGNYLLTKTLSKHINLPCKRAVLQLSWRGLYCIWYYFHLTNLFNMVWRGSCPDTLNMDPMVFPVHFFSSDGMCS